MDINQLGPMEEDFVASTVCAVLCRYIEVPCHYILARRKE
jgi:hypothetical protein